MKHSAKKRLALLAALVIACPQAAAPVFAAEGERESQPAASAAAAMSVQEESSKRVGVIVTPFKDITFGQTPGDPSAVQVDQGNGIDENAAFTYRYVGVGKTNYNSKKKPLEAGRYQVIATLDSATHSGEGVSVPFAIRKAEDGSIKRSITVSVIEEKQTIHLSDLNLYSGMEKGARIKRVSKGSGDDIFETVTVGADAASVDLNMKPVEDGASQILTLILESDNYKKLTAIVTVTAVVTAEDIEVIHTEVKAPGVFSYGTPLKDIIDLEKCAATLNGRSISGTFTLLEPEKRYNVGEDTEVALRFTTSGGKEYIKTVPIEFTIEPLDVTPIGYDEQFFNDGYYILIYANSPYNVSEKTLEELIPARKDSFKVAVGGEEIELDASWTANENNPPFEVQGQKPHYAEDIFWYDWYAYTATLTPKGIDAKNLAIADISPKAYVRVIPIDVTLSFADGSAKMISADDVMALTEANWKNEMKLPEWANAVCVPVEEVQYIDRRDRFTGETGKYAIAGWKMDGADLTLAALKAKAADAVNGDVTITLTPVYTYAPAWGDFTDVPTFELTITRGGNKKS